MTKLKEKFISLVSRIGRNISFKSKLSKFKQIWDQNVVDDIMVSSVNEYQLQNHFTELQEYT